MLGPIRSNRATLIVLGAIIFLAAFVGLAYNHVDRWELPEGLVSQRCFLMRSCGIISCSFSDQCGSVY